ncbi:1-deoxy-D-xylulose-5-phosphate synthase [Paraburkholderia sp. CNPSo 3281]|uniref:1-deoxy-D-xylulose-5-phosphate synthase n=1 Tax=Paraburkholderia sp. CNPSo 3281 TaxID=2940933 RepID=UPI0020B6A2F8|nr:1-deoxy-D-xylulose-5-phosphate synthase [Paraburkholderia sp. CNPSo 3281]MCP3715900.1 1-deoxy-D-xylulose-5-phosphate synthase [Paraburkholderia sp. CNPSo 3281]
MNLLDMIDFPNNLRDLEERELQRLVDEVREFVIESVSSTGGHLASNLGVVELSVALHYVFDTPRDRLVWDVGHQCYPHKILTGRKAGMASVRKVGGMAGFPARDESPYDAFGVGHAGTSISAAVGMALGLRGRDARVVAVIGDGSLSAGMAYEALNHAGSCEALPLTIVLNDNRMSISPAVGGLNDHLESLVTRWRDEAKVPLANLFETLGLDYVGPVDGHDMAKLLAALRDAKTRNRPHVIHVVTKKGKGYRPAEREPVAYHGPSPFKPETGLVRPRGGKLTYSQVFGQWLCDSATTDERIFGITPAMSEGSCLTEFERRYPDRYIDVGIAEQHAVTLAAGLAVEGMRPVVAIYSTFLQRGYDQLIHDVALQNLPVLFALDRAGIAGGDGATHLGAFDIAALRCVPNMVVMTPSDEKECYRMLNTGLAWPGPCAVRYPRATTGSEVIEQTKETLPLGRGVICRVSGEQGGARVAFLAFGPLLSVAMEVAKEIDATVVDMRFVKPLDEDLLLTVANEHEVIVTLEEGTVIGGAGAACAERIAAEGWAVRMLRLGLPDEFVQHGDRSELLRLNGLGVAGVRAAVMAFTEEVDVLDKVG